jgi:hypothetical protein
MAFPIFLALWSVVRSYCFCVWSWKNLSTFLPRFPATLALRPGIFLLLSSHQPFTLTLNCYLKNTPYESLLLAILYRNRLRIFRKNKQVLAEMPVIFVDKQAYPHKPTKILSNISEHLFWGFRNRNQGKECLSLISRRSNPENSFSYGSKRLIS